MNILVTGYFDPDYNRNNILFHGLRKRGHEVIQKPFRKKRISNAEKKEIKGIDKQVDVIYMPSFTHVNVRSVKKIVSKPLLFDPLISRYLSKVFDYKAVWKYSPRAYKNFLKDKLSMSKADIVFADTNAHKKYYHDVIGIGLDKIHVLPVGVNEERFFPVKKAKHTDKKFIVGFYGSFIPLHGMDVIVETAAILNDNKDIAIVILGDGVQYKAIKEHIHRLTIKNMNLKGWINYDSLNDEINQFDVCLGIFGSSLKTDLVVPNKIYHYLACRKPVITKETVAIKEIFQDGSDIQLCKAAPQDIADKIMMLKEDAELRNKLANTGYNKVIAEFNSTSIADKFIQAVNTL